MYFLLLACSAFYKKIPSIQSVFALFPFLFLFVITIRRLAENNAIAGNSQSTLDVVLVISLLLMFFYQGQTAVAKERAIRKCMTYSVLAFFFSFVGALPLVIAHMAGVQVLTLEALSENVLFVIFGIFGFLTFLEVRSVQTNA